MIVNTLPPRAGVGLKSEHYETILQNRPDIGWFEIHAENYMMDGGPAHLYLEKIAEIYPISIHGVGLSIGGTQDLNQAHLNRLKTLFERHPAHSFSEHLAWSTHDSHFYNDLLPLPYNDQTLEHVSRHINQVQDFLGRQMLLENPSSYLSFDDSTYSETDFLHRLVEQTGCGLLLDVNNVFISATNLEYSPENYLSNFPLGHVGEIHLAGHAEDEDEFGKPLLIDAHDREVADPVWQLYKFVLSKTGPIPTLIEWDNEVPTWEILFQQAVIADRALASRQETQGRHARVG